MTFVGYRLIASSFDLELDYNEGWNAYHQRNAITGILYPNTLGYVFTNYTPLSFYLIGYLSRHGDPILVGRIVSIVSFFVLVGTVGLTARNLGSSRKEALLAAVMSIGLLGAFHGDYIGIDDPQLLGTAVSVLGLAVWSHAPARVSDTVASLLIFAIAGLIKQTLFVIPTAIAVELFLRDTGIGLRFCVIGVVIVMIALLALDVTFGGAVFAQLLSPRLYSIHRAAVSTSKYLIENAVYFPLALIFLAMYRANGANRFILIYLIVALSAGALMRGGSGTGDNLFIDLAVGLSLATAAIVRTLCVDLCASTGIVAALIALSIYSLALRIPYSLELFRDGLAGTLRSDEVDFEDDVAFVQKQPGLAFCQSPMLCFRAGRPFSIDPFGASQAIRLNRVDATPMLTALAQGGFGVVQLSTINRAPALGPPENGGPDVQQEFERILTARYHKARTNRRRVFYLPNQSR